MNNPNFIELNVCPGCNSKKNKTLYLCEFLKSPIKDYLESFYANVGGIEFEYLKEANYILNECLNCGMIYQKEILNNFLMNKLYNEWMDPQKTFSLINQLKLENYKVYAQEICMIIEFFNKRPSQLNFLDFGMGWGRWCLMAKAFGCNCYGIELSLSKIEYSKSLGINVISYDEIPNYTFDFINIESVFEHIPKPLEILCFLKKSLSSEGLIKISVPNGEDIKRRLKILDWTASKGSKNSLNAVSPLEHINCFNPKAIIKMANIAGLENVTIPSNIHYTFTINRSFILSILLTFFNILFKYKKILKRKYRYGTYLFFRKK